LETSDIDEQSVIDRCNRTGSAIPDKILNAPELWLGLDYFYDIFMELSNDRGVGMGLGPIPSHSIRAFCKDTGCTFEEQSEITHIIRQLDSVYLKFYSEKTKAK
jgi:hypothetical protein